jgi:hypothetical protein
MLGYYLDWAMIGSFQILPNSSVILAFDVVLAFDGVVKASLPTPQEEGKKNSEFSTFLDILCLRSFKFGSKAMKRPSEKCIKI